MSGGRSDPVTIRAATPADVPAMQSIEVEAGEPFRAVGLGRVADDAPPSTALLLSHVHAGTAWVAVEPGTEGPSGYALGSEVDGEGHLDQVSVRPPAMGRGIGSMLVTTVCRWSRAAGHRSVTLTTYRDLSWNGPWYARRGFRELQPEELTPGLRATLAQQRADGLEPPPRIAMRRPADP